MITSHFRNATDCQLAWMTINLRNRVAAPITDLHAGNYEMPIRLDETNAKDANVVRYNLNAGVPYTRQIPGPALPGFCGTCHNAFISNWSTFDFEMKLEGVEQKLMIPLMPGDPAAIPFDVAVIFRPTPATLGVCNRRAYPGPLELLELSKSTQSTYGRSLGCRVFYISKWGTRAGLKVPDFS